MRTLGRTVVLCGVIASAAARAQSPAELENPGQVAAVQERLYRMSQELALGVGVLPLDAFYKGVTPSLSYAWHFSDTFAWQIGRASYSYNVNTQLRQQLERQFGVLPTAFDVVEWFAGTDIIWSPLYGKTSFMNTQVMHFSGHLIAGGTVFRMNTGFRPALHFGVGVRLFHSRFISFRLDVTDNLVIPLQWPVSNIVNVPHVSLVTALNFGSSE
jgi:outer membrane beta-barrel protein